MKKIKVIAIIGKAGSGKDTLMKSILKWEPNIHEIVSFTSRPIRENEIDGVNYHFITPIEFRKRINDKQIFEYTVYNEDWYYGTGIESYKEDCINIGVFNPDGVRQLLLNPQVEVTVFYTQANGKVRLIRQLNREYNPNVNEIVRRYSTDEKDFSNLDFDYTVLRNEYWEDIQINTDKILTAISNQ